MRFSTKDLMVSVTPQLGKDAQLCVFHTTICLKPTLYCHYPTIQPCQAHTSLLCCNIGTLDCRGITRHGCGGFGSCGGPGGSACDTTYVCPGSWWEIEHIEDLVTIKEDLRQVMTKLDEIEKVGLPSQFETRAHAEAAEAALAQALEHVRAQKLKLK